MSQPSFRTTTKFFSHLIVLRAAQSMQRGDTLRITDLTAETEVPDNILQEWLDQLCACGLLHQIQTGGIERWTLARDPDSLFLADIQKALAEHPMRVPAEWTDTAIGKTLAGLYFRLERERNAMLGEISIRQLMQGERDNGDV